MHDESGQWIDEGGAMTTPSSPSRLHDRVVDAVGRRIITDELRPGEIIVPESLRAEFGVSASVVREAFRALAAKGLINAKSKVGTKVTPTEQWNFLDPQVIQWRIESVHRDEQVAEFFEVRLALEPVAAQLLADRSDDDAVERLRDCVARMQEAMARDDLRAFVKADVEFHAILVAESGNQMFATLRGIVELAVGVREILYYPFSGAARHGLDLHVTLVDDIVAGNPETWQTSREMLIAAREEMRVELAGRE